MICSEVNWPRFQPVFDTRRKLVDADFESVNKLRNVVFHFRRSITPNDTDRLRFNRELWQNQLSSIAKVEDTAIAVVR